MGAKRRKVTQTKTSLTRRKLVPTSNEQEKTDRKNKVKAGGSRATAASSGNSTSQINSYDQPICNLIPDTRRKKQRVDFQDPPNLAP